MTRPLRAAATSALWLAAVIVALVAVSLWLRDAKSADHRVGQRVRLQSDSPLPRLPRVSLGGEFREAWFLKAGDILRFAVTVPGEEPVLRLREGFLTGLPDMAVTLVTPNGRRRELFSGPASEGHWGEHRLAVSARPGEAVDLEIAVLDGRGRPGLGALYVADVVLESQGRPVDEDEVAIVTRAVLTDVLSEYSGVARRAPATEESRRVDLPGPMCVPLAPDETIRLSYDGAHDGADARLELVLFAARDAGVQTDPERSADDGPGEVQVLSGADVVRRVPLDFAAGGSHEVSLSLDLPLRARRAPELGFRRVGGAGLFVGLREAVVTGPRRVARRPFVPGESRNVLLVSVGSLRPDRLGCYGYPGAATPNLDATAARGLRYTSTWAPSSWALPNVASLLTGTSPITHGLGLGAYRRLSPRLITLARAAAWSGRSTAAFSSSPEVSRRMGLDQGYETFAMRYLPAPVLVERAIDWLVEMEPFEWFLTLHLNDPGYPHDPEYVDVVAVNGVLDPVLVERVRRLDSRPGLAEALAQEMGPLYDAEIAGVDRALGRLLGWLQQRGLLDDTLVVVVGSHGVEFFEHGGRTHGQTLFDEVLHVPLLIAGPGVPPDGPVGGVIEAPTELIDVSRLIAERMGLQLAGSHQGHLPAPWGSALDRPTIWPAVLFPFEGIVDRQLEAVRSERWLWLSDTQSGARSLFDREADPEVRQDLLSVPEPGPEALNAAARLALEFEQWYGAAWLSAAPRAVVLEDEG